ncbi:MAG: preprotein translocase subunit YajC [Puniceicoccales bacterium]|jgi:preprotein translocase subunit YajC|nr:preprotein translocase subunit YajC [Puniceicoccales bacterium]
MAFYIPVFADTASATSPAVPASPSQNALPGTSAGNAAPAANATAPAAGGAASAPAGNALPASNAAPAAGQQGAAAGATAGTSVPPPAPHPQQQQEGSLLMTFGPFILIFVAFYFLLIRPQQKREKEIRKKQSELKSGDQVLTAAGIFGKVVKLDGDRVTLDVGENTRLTFQRSAIVGFTADPNAAAGDAAKSENQNNKK